MDRTLGKLPGRILALVAFGLALAVTVAACGGGGSSTGGGGGSGTTASTAEACPETIVVGGHTTSTGGAAVYGKSFEPALELWAKEVDAKGGILGSEVELKFADDGFDNSRGGSVATQLTSREGANFVIGPVAPGPASVAAPIYEREDVLALAPTTAGPAYEPESGVRNATMYSTAVERRQFMTVVGEYLKSQGYEHPGLLVSNDTYGPPYQEDTEAAFEQLGIEIAGVEEFDVESPDLVSQVRALREDGADVVIPLMVATEAFANAFTAMERIGWTPPIAGPYALGSAPWEQFESLVPHAAFAEYAAVTREGSKPASATSAKVGAALRNVPVFDYGIESYLAGEVLDKAITKAGSCETQKVIEALTSISEEVMGQQVEFPAGSQIGGTEKSVKMVKPLSNDPKTGLLEVVKQG